mmetsp:Transcript_51398/g.123690  ORF Transcript_51398/g.123690 Transcript_51398/m.123690 type:complete len:222 (-) Transcript_51398:264-929(-)
MQSWPRVKTSAVSPQALLTGSSWPMSQACRWPRISCCFCRAPPSHARSTPSFWRRLPGACTRCASRTTTATRSARSAGRRASATRSSAWRPSTAASAASRATTSSCAWRARWPTSAPRARRGPATSTRPPACPSGAASAPPATPRALGRRRTSGTAGSCRGWCSSPGCATCRSGRGSWGLRPLRRAASSAWRACTTRCCARSKHRSPRGRQRAPCPRALCL